MTARAAHEGDAGCDIPQFVDTALEQADINPEFVSGKRVRGMIGDGGKAARPRTRGLAQVGAKRGRSIEVMICKARMRLRARQRRISRPSVRNPGAAALIPLDHQVPDMVLGRLRHADVRCREALALDRGGGVVVDVSCALQMKIEPHIASSDEALHAAVRGRPKSDHVGHAAL